MSRVVVIGAGLAGWVAANRLADNGHSVVLLHKGLGGLQLGQGSIDVFGYDPARVTNPIAAVAAASAPHPYATLGTGSVVAAVAYLRQLLPDLLVGDLEANYQLPTAVGAIRPTCLAQPSMIAGNAHDGASWVIVGLRRLKDFSAELIAANLSRTELPDGGRLQARAITIDVAARESEIDSTGLTFARAFDDPDFRKRFTAALAPQLKPGETVGLPAVLGLADPTAWSDVAANLGHDVFEIPLPPPSVLGMRLDQALRARALEVGVRVVPGVRTVAFDAEGGRVRSVSIATEPAPRSFTADAFVLATGGFESGALELDSYGQVHETLFDLPVTTVDTALFHGDYWGPEQPLFTIGVPVNAAMQPVDASGASVYANLHAAGGILAGNAGWRDKTGDGVAAASALAAADAIGKERP